MNLQMNFGLLETGSSVNDVYSFLQEATGGHLNLDKMQEWKL